MILRKIVTKIRYSPQNCFSVFNLFIRKQFKEFVVSVLLRQIGPTKTLACDSCSVIRVD